MRAMTMEPQIDFRNLEQGDLRLLHQWLNEEQVLRWYSKRPPTIEAVAQKYLPRIEGLEPTKVYIFSVDGEDAGLVQTYDVMKCPEYARTIGAEVGWAGLDYFTGETAFRGRGLAPRMIDRFVNEIVFGLLGANACVSGPAVENAKSIRTLERAGFTILRTVQVAAGEFECLMIRRSDAHNAA